MFCDFFDFLLFDVSPSSMGVKVSHSGAIFMECLGLLMARLSSSYFGSVSESVYGKLRIFVFFTVGCSELVSKSNFFFSLLDFMLEILSSGDPGRALLLLELL
jgi:hypothetical protein